MKKADPAMSLRGLLGLRKPMEDDAILLDAAIQRGFPSSAVGRVKDAAEATDAEFGRLLGVHPRTLFRVVRRGGRLDPAASDRLYRFATVFARAAEVLESADVARQWLRVPQFGLGGAAPLALLTTDAGTRTVLDLLGRIDYGNLA